MPDYAWWIICILAGYLMGSIPSGYVAVRLTRGFDLRRHGTGGIGLSNVWHATRSYWVIAPVVLFDIIKAMPAVWLAHFVGLDLTAQIIVGFAAIIGHNWPVFLRFQGGRGMLTTIGYAFIVPVVNGMVPWPLIAGVTLVLILVAVTRSSALAVWCAIATPQVAGIIMGDPLPLIIGYIGIFVLMNFRRLVQPRSELSRGMSWRQVLFYRLFLDRDIRDRQKWVDQSREKKSPAAGK